MFPVLAFVVWFTIMNLATTTPVKNQSKDNIVNKATDQAPLVTAKSFTMDRDTYREILSRDMQNMASVYKKHDIYDFELVCPTEVSAGPNDPPNKRSTCPWYYSFRHNPKQHPATIVNAESLCEYSIGSNKTLECVPVTHKIQVLQLQNHKGDKGNYIWTEAERIVVVGYTSASRRTDYNLDKHTQSGKEKPKFE